MSSTGILTPNKDLRALLKQVRKQGFEAYKAGTGHIVITPPGPNGHMNRISCSATPRDPRTIRNVRAQLKRHGARL